MNQNHVSPVRMRCKEQHHLYNIPAQGGNLTLNAQKHQTQIEILQNNQPVIFKSDSHESQGEIKNLVQTKGD